MGGGVSLLDLAENLRLANDHRIKPGGDFEEVMQTVRLGKGVKLVAQCAVVGMMLDEKLFNSGKKCTPCYDLNVVLSGNPAFHGYTI